MIKKEKGITLIALVITIVIMLMMASIGIATIYDNKKTVETAEVIKNGKIYQDYKTALEMAISEKQVKDSTKQVDENYLYDLMINIKKEDIFKDCAEDDIRLRGYNIYANQLNNDSLNAIYIKTKEGYEFVIDINLEIHDITEKDNTSSSDPTSDPSSDPNSQHTHSYKYYNDATGEAYTNHPTAAGTYKYKCTCGDIKSTHKVEGITQKENDEEYHYKYICSCGLNETEAHNMQEISHSGSPCIEYTITERCIRCNWEKTTTTTGPGQHSTARYYCFKNTENGVYYEYSTSHPTQIVNSYTSHGISVTVDHSAEMRLICDYCKGTISSHTYTTYSNYQKTSSQHSKTKCSCGILIDAGSHKCKNCDSTDFSSRCTKSTNQSAHCHVCSTCSASGSTISSHQCKFCRSTNSGECPVSGATKHTCYCGKMF